MGRKMYFVHIVVVLPSLGGLRTMGSWQPQQPPDLVGVVTMGWPRIAVSTAMATDLLYYSFASYQQIDEFEQQLRLGPAADTTFPTEAAAAKGQNRSADRLARPAALNEWRLLPSHADNIISASFRSRSQNNYTGRSTYTHAHTLAAVLLLLLRCYNTEKQHTF